ncbi:unnamed protein product [Cuscuta campestris]|uniref:HMA domain-containing protein n=1 Tax=Cuscuta campestris TaxID=132261 RepID=A0A484KG21_9ASTE|nr:unnamed protein product [Cuscuta campestris]
MPPESQRMQGNRVTEVQVRMDCNGCVQKIKKALHGVHGISELYIDVPGQKLTLIGNADPGLIVKAIKKIRKSAIICSHTELPDEEPSKPPEEQPPEEEGGGGAPPSTAEPIKPPSEEPHKDTPPPPPHEINQPPEEIPSPEAAPKMTRIPSNDMKDVHQRVHRYPSAYYRYGYGDGPPQWSHYQPSGSMGFRRQPPPTDLGFQFEPPPPPQNNGSRLVYEPPPRPNSSRFRYESPSPPRDSSRTRQEAPPPPLPPRNPTFKHDHGREPPYDSDLKCDSNLTRSCSWIKQEPPPPLGSSSRLERQEPMPRGGRGVNWVLARAKSVLGGGGGLSSSSELAVLGSGGMLGFLGFVDQPIPVLYQDGLDFRHRQEPPSPPSYTLEFNPPPHQSLSGFMQPVYVSHSYNAYKPSPYVTGYEFAPPPPPRAMYHRRADPYAEGMYRTPRPYAGYDYSEDSHNGNNSNANISSMFSEENPNACAIS